MIVFHNVLYIIIIINFCLNPLCFDCQFLVDHCLVHSKGCVRPHSYCFIPALGCEECRVTALRLLALDGRSAKLAGGLSSDPILSGLSRTVQQTFFQRMLSMRRRFFSTCSVCVNFLWLLTVFLEHTQHMQAFCQRTLSMHRPFFSAHSACAENTKWRIYVCRRLQNKNFSSPQVAYQDRIYQCKKWVENFTHGHL